MLSYNRRWGKTSWCYINILFLIHLFSPLLASMDGPFWTNLWLSQLQMVISDSYICWDLLFLPLLVFFICVLCFLEFVVSPSPLSTCAFWDFTLKRSSLIAFILYNRWALVLPFICNAHIVTYLTADSPFKMTSLSFNYVLTFWTTQCSKLIPRRFSKEPLSMEK